MLNVAIGGLLILFAAERAITGDDALGLPALVSINLVCFQIDAQELEGVLSDTNAHVNPRVMLG
jgi:hypothetical protein